MAPCAISEAPSAPCVASAAPARFQVSLASALLIMVAAGGCLYLQMHPPTRCTDGFGEHLNGWPLGFYFKFWTSSGIHYSFFLKNLFIDMVLSLAACGALVAPCEWYMRRKTTAHE
ncbi:MAG: hypothetical protein L6R28_00925 [Planctomycetes bacterium]|nr:hypothetical protein [Planctomycetota bacterium]